VASLKRNSLDIGVLDFETDPFLAGRVPYPFAACIYFSASDYRVIWEPKCVPQVIAMIRKLPPCVLYAHNGGKFDFHYLLEYSNPGTVIIRNGRVVEMHIGRVTLKDSWPLMPFSLATYNKEKVDYAIFEKARRNVPKNKKVITNYLISDCKNLIDLVTGFRAIVGEKDTIGSAAFYNMRKMGIKIVSLNESHDAQFREFYFGGRVEAVQKGIFKGRFNYLDINSAYPFAMKERHPHGADYIMGKKFPRRIKYGPQFIRCIARSEGAFPLRLYSNTGAPLGIDFPRDMEPREYCVTGWEYKAALETNTAKIEKILEVWIPQTMIEFGNYVDTFFEKRAEAKREGDKIAALAYKYLLNSGYGKFAQNPRDFREYCLEEYGVDVDGFDWEADFGAISLWSKPSYHGRGFFDVATGASITGLVRSILWRGACAATNVLYMDTDALACTKASVAMGDKLGQWKVEGIAKTVAIAGKKLYAIEWEKPDSDGETTKIASKGARLSYKEILDICGGKTVKWSNAAPTFSVLEPLEIDEGNRKADGGHFVNRNIRRT
jgi:DNA polymerase elongation subunit (family B)